MKRPSLYLTLLSLLSKMLLAQGETAVPFLRISSNPDGNGWGGISSAVVSNNAMAPIANPAQLGVFSLNNLFLASTYVPKTEWLPSFGLSDLTYDVTAANIGLNLKSWFSLPVPISIGLGYSRIYLSLGRFIITGPGGPEPLGYFDAHEKAEGFTLAFGMDCFVRFGFGWNFKNITSSLAPITPGAAGGVGSARVSATDFRYA